MTIFDRLAPIYDHLSKPFTLNLEKHIINRICFEKNHQVLDVGGGTGRFMRIKDSRLISKRLIFSSTYYTQKGDKNLQGTRYNIRVLLSRGVKR